MSKRGHRLAAAICALLLAAGVASAADWMVVVNADNPESALPSSSVSEFFLKRTSTWEDGTPVVPYDRPVDSSLRKSFSVTVLGREADNIKQYWLTQVFRGSKLVPPVEKRNDSDVLAAVAADRGAIGYVAADAELPAGVKELRVPVSLTAPPKILSRVAPRYTEQARRTLTQGTVVLQVEVDREGEVLTVKSLKGLPFGLTDEATRAVRRWRFEPTQKSGAAVGAIFSLTLDFRPS